LAARPADRWYATARTRSGAYERDTVHNVRVIALPPSNILAATENGIFPREPQTMPMVTLRLDHRNQRSARVSIRYNDENLQSLRSAAVVTSDSSQVDVINRSHSLVAETMWTPSQRTANALRAHVINHTLGTTPRSSIIGVISPAGSIGQTNRDSQVVSRTRFVLSDTFYRHTSRHDLKAGGELALAAHDFDSRVFEYGVFQFTTDRPFESEHAVDVAEHVQPAGADRFELRLAGAGGISSRRLAAVRARPRERRRPLRRGLESPDQRLHGTHARRSRDGRYRLFRLGDRGTDTNNVQPRIGATWDARGNGRLIVRGGTGVYVTRNRPWYQLRSINQFTSSVVRITDAERLRHYPDISAVLGGRSLESFIAAGGARQIGTVIPDDFVQGYAVNTTAGIGWQLRKTAALDVDYIHSSGFHQVGSTDRNLPPSGPVSVTNPRPVPQFAQVVMLENFSRSWYDALECSCASIAGRASRFRCRTRSRAAIWTAWILPHHPRHAAHATRARLQSERPAPQPDRGGIVRASLGRAGERNPEACQRVAREGSVRRRPGSRSDGDRRPADRDSHYRRT
jgi:hypothetical protein